MKPTAEQLQNRIKWVEALESGNYKQGDGRLETIREGQSYFCCLGVWCDLAKDKLERSTSIGRNFALYDGVSGYLPDGGLDMLGFEDERGELAEVITYNGKPYDNLADLNDYGMDFPSIIKIIKDQLINPYL